MQKQDQKFKLSKAKFLSYIFLAIPEEISYSKLLRLSKILATILRREDYLEKLMKWVFEEVEYLKNMMVVVKSHKTYENLYILNPGADKEKMINDFRRAMKYLKIDLKWEEFINLMNILNKIA